jgi:hypothetical protein
MNDANNARLSDPSHYLVASKGLELFGNDAGRAIDIVAELGILVQIPPPPRDFADQIGGSVDDWHGPSLPGANSQN